jgi:hypothetical protein
MFSYHRGDEGPSRASIPFGCCSPTTCDIELLAGENQTLLVRGNALLVLDLGLDVVNRVGRLNVQGDGLSGDHPSSIPISSIINSSLLITSKS